MTTETAISRQTKSGSEASATSVHGKSRPRRALGVGEISFSIHHARPPPTPPPPRHDLQTKGKKSQTKGIQSTGRPTPSPRAAGRRAGRRPARSSKIRTRSIPTRMALSRHCVPCKPLSSVSASLPESCNNNQKRDRYIADHGKRWQQGQAGDA
ncbi:hypothetical protein SEVIR_8G087066v4 [Setaria viridis]